MSKKVSMTARPNAVPPAADKWVGQRTAKAAPAGPIKRLTIDLEKDKHTRFKVLCAEQGLNADGQLHLPIDDE
jgi:hypothetical protein